MTGRLEELLDEIPSPSGEGVFNVRRLQTGSAFYAGRDSRGCAAVLVENSAERSNSAASACRHRGNILNGVPSR